MHSHQHRAWTYTVTDPPGTLAVSLDDVKEALKITSGSQDDLITSFINAAINYAEQFTRRDFITRTYETFRDDFPRSRCQYPGNIGFELRRSKLQEIEKIEYFVAGVLTLVSASIYYNTIETDYSEVLTLQNNTWPTDVDVRLQAIKITFKTGFGDADTDMPPWIKEGVFQHVANMYANRGDCSDAVSSASLFLPATARLLYLQNRIENL